MLFKEIFYLELGRGHCWEHSCEIILKLDQWFTTCLKKKFTDAQRTKTNHNSSPGAFYSDELKTAAVTH